MHPWLSKCNGDWCGDDDKRTGNLNFNNIWIRARRHHIYIRSSISDQRVADVKTVLMNNKRPTYPLSFTAHILPTMVKITFLVTAVVSLSNLCKGVCIVILCHWNNGFHFVWQILWVFLDYFWLKIPLIFWIIIVVRDVPSISNCKYFQLITLCSIKFNRLLWDWDVLTWINLWRCDSEYPGSDLMMTIV